MQQKIAIIDCDSILFSASYGGKGVEKSELEMLESLDQIMRDFLTNSESTHYIAYVKGKGNYRYAINSEYKQNRPKESPYWWKSLKAYIISKWSAFEVNGIEVDDACRITKNRLKNSFIASIDNDLLMLEGLAYNWRKNAWIETSRKEAEYKFWSDMIVGQPGDNVKGIPGCGKAYAERALSKAKFLPEEVLSHYISKFRDVSVGIDEFYKNFKSLYILEDHKDFVVPNLVEFSRNREIDWDTV